MKQGKAIVLLILLSAVGYIYTQKIYLTNPTLHKYLYYSQCDTPLTYRIGSIDKRFGITEKQLSQTITQAADIWNKTYGKKLITEDDQGTVTINMVYDERQALSNQISNLENKLNQDQGQFKPQMAEYEKKVADFKQRVQALNDEIESWNKKGGAPHDEYQKLKAEQEALQQESQELNAMAKSLNRSADQYNTEIGQYNTTVNSFNQALEFKPEEGLYIPQEEKINIYFNNSHQELEHTLAHELGHALGMDHNSNKLSIMYPYTNQQITPSTEDKTALDDVCREQSVFSNAENRLNTYMNYLQQLLQKQISSQS